MPTTTLNLTDTELLELREFVFDDDVDVKDVERQVLAEMWFQADLSAIMRADGQLRIYTATHAWKELDPTGLTHVFVLCHRRLGKSFCGLAMGIERCLSRPNQIVKYGAPTKEDCRDIVIPNLEAVLETCPDVLRPHKAGDWYYFNNPRWGNPRATSKLQLVGVNVRKGNALRGQACDMFIADETREMLNLPYLMGDIMAPQFVGRYRPLILQLTTPPASMHHSTVQKYIPRAKEAGRLIVIPAFDCEHELVDGACKGNDDFSLDDAKIIAAEIGRDTSAWNREVQVKLESDEDQLIVPEFVQTRETCLVKDWKRPSHFWTYGSLDTAWIDYNAYLLGYIDFEHQKLVVEHTVWGNMQTTGQLADNIRDAEDEVYPKTMLQDMSFPGHRFHVRRHADMTKKDMGNFRFEQGLFFKDAIKHDRAEAIGSLRTGFSNGRIIILDNAANAPLIFQLTHGVWNEKRLDFERGEGLMGHCDALAALIYLWRVVKWRQNPFPNVGYNSATQSPDLRDYEGRQKNKEALRRAFNVGPKQSSGSRILLGGSSRRRLGL